jgi:phage terminase large subunit-like protein
VFLGGRGAGKTRAGAEWVWDVAARLGADDAGGRSPDRADALVWALTELMIPRGAGPRIRVL